MLKNMFGIFCNHPMIEYHTKCGINTLDLMIKFLSIFGMEPPEYEKEYNRLVLWLTEKLKRNITPKEEIALGEGIIKYINSAPETNERSEAMKYLFEAQFLNDDATKK